MEKRNSKIIQAHNKAKSKLKFLVKLLFSHRIMLKHTIEDGQTETDDASGYVNNDLIYIQ